MHELYLNERGGSHGQKERRGFFKIDWSQRHHSHSSIFKYSWFSTIQTLEGIIEYLNPQQRGEKAFGFLPYQSGKNVLKIMENMMRLIED